jgi:prepilin-type N-terminal cleavage/methylation domain-containing protein
MRTSDKQPGFTLLELIMVMVILAIAAAIVVPTLRGFALSRATESATEQVLTLAHYGRTQAINEGRNFHLNFDTRAGQVWLTALDQNTNTYIPPTNEYGDRYTLPRGISLTVDVDPQPNTGLVQPASIQQSTVTPTPLYGQPIAAQSNAIIQNQHTDGTYMEFQPSGRNDPAHMQLTDSLGTTVNLGCSTATESLHVLTSVELK